MFTVEFQTGALLLLAAAALTIAWILWCDRNDRETARVQALEGVGHEMRINLQRFMAELSAISFDEPVSAEEMLPVNHPQLDAVFANLVRGNANALSVLSAGAQGRCARGARQPWQSQGRGRTRDRRPARRDRDALSLGGA